MKKAQLIKLLMAMRDNAQACSKLVNNEKCAQYLKGESYGISTVIDMLTDNKYLNDMADIFERNGLLK